MPGTAREDGLLICLRNAWVRSCKKALSLLLCLYEKVKQVILLELPKRKQNRLTEYDYSTPNAYFITICTNNRKNLFWKDVGAVMWPPVQCPADEPG